MLVGLDAAAQSPVRDLVESRLSQAAILVADDGVFQFGQSLAAERDVLVVGAPGGDERGAVYVFTRDGGIWNEQAKLIPSDGESVGAFGSSVALSGHTLVVGDLGAQGRAAAYVFERVRDSAGSVSWIQRQKVCVSAACDNPWPVADAT
jgi:hypothetical protein